MDGLFGDLVEQGVVVFQDDILIASPNMDKHLDTLEMVLYRLRRHKFKVSWMKCSFMSENTQFLGYKLSARGIEPIGTKIDALAETPIPENAKQLHSFLGLINYYSRFIEGLARLVRPLYALLKKGAEWLWTDAHTTIFNHLKEVMTSKPILASFELGAETYVYTDASTMVLVRSLPKCLLGSRAWTRPGLSITLALH